MKLVQTLFALALAGTMATSAYADATYDMGPLTPTPYINTATVSGSFMDTYDFVVPSSLVAGTGVTANLDLGNLSFHISNLKLELFDANSTKLASDTVSGPTDYSVSVNAPLTTGSYYFLLSGLADGTNTNQGIYTFTAAAVPEAKTYGMMLAGLGLVGFVVMRRRSV